MAVSPCFLRRVWGAQSGCHAGGCPCRTSLGAVVAATIRAAEDLADCPISREAGIWPDARPVLDRVAQDHGWPSYEAVRYDARLATSARWVHYNLDVVACLRFSVFCVKMPGAPTR